MIDGYIYSAGRTDGGIPFYRRPVALVGTSIIYGPINAETLRYNIKEQN